MVEIARYFLMKIPFGMSFELVHSFLFCSYVALEYAGIGMLNERSEVYSFGILIMEIISGRNQFITVTRHKRFALKF